MIKKKTIKTKKTKPKIANHEKMVSVLDVVEQQQEEMHERLDLLEKKSKEIMMENESLRIQLHAEQGNSRLWAKAYSDLSDKFLNVIICQLKQTAFKPCALCKEQ